MCPTHVASRRLAISVGLGCALIAAGPSRVAHAQDTRDVKEPRLPAVCATLTASLSTVSGAVSDAAEATLDTKRIQDAIEQCAAGARAGSTRQTVAGRPPPATVARCTRRSRKPRPTRATPKMIA